MSIATDVSPSAAAHPGLDEATRAALAAGVLARPGRETGIEWIRRSAAGTSSSFTIVHLEVCTTGGQTLQVVLKNLSPAGVRLPKPHFLYDPRREIEVYRHVLDGRDLGAPQLYGWRVDERWQTYLLFIERIDGTELYQLGQITHWERAAEWLARLHARFEGDAVSQLCSPARLIVHDRACLARWIRRAARLAPRMGGIDAAALRGLDRLVERYDTVAARLAELPRTLLHGECFASSILIERPRQPEEAVVRAVDWELAGAGPGVIDLAALVAGKWSDEQRRHLVQAYHRQFERASGKALSLPALLESLDFARLHLAVQMLGWSRNFSPPPQHAHDWLGDAMRLGSRLGLV